MTARKGENIQIYSFQHLTYRIQAQPQKRGQKGYYTGSRLAFLTGYCDEYNALRGKDRHQFWHKLFSEWWARYPWRLEDHEEPPASNLEKMVELAFVGGELDVEKKAEVEQKVRDVGSIVQVFYICGSRPFYSGSRAGSATARRPEPTTRSASGLHSSSGSTSSPTPSPGAVLQLSSSCSKSRPSSMQPSSQGTAKGKDSTELIA